MRVLRISVDLMLSLESQEPFDVAAWLDGPDLWDTKSGQLPKPFRWLSQQRQTAQIPYKNFVSLGKMEVGEVTVRFKDGNLSSLALSLFARRDDPALNRQHFLTRVKQAEIWLTKHTGQDPIRVKTTANVTKAQRLGWETTTSHFHLGHHSQRAHKLRDHPFQGKFIRIEILTKRERAPIERSATWLKQQVQKD